MGSKFSSTGVLEGLFSTLYGGTPRIVLMTSSDVIPTITGASSNASGCLVQATQGAYPSTSYFVVTSSGNNRVCQILACSCDVAYNSGVASYVCLIDPSSSIRYVTTCTTQSITAGNKVNIGTWYITVNQPT